MRLVGRILAALLVVVLVLLLGLVASQTRSPLLSPYRAVLLYALPLAGMVLMVLGVGLWRGGRRSGGLLALCGLAIGALPPGLEWRQREQRASVLLEAPPDKLDRWGRHMVLGYTSFDEMREILERMTLAGIYVTARNVRDHTAEEVALEIRRLQAIQRAHHRPPLLVAADQEGGPVSRLSPPLDAAPGLGEVAESPDWRGAVAAYARRTARALRRLQVTVNFAPVVDLRLGTDRSLDLHSNLEQRAIAGEPSRVAEVAELYAKTLWEEGVLATVKHFPGLGHVAEDTHFFPGRLELDPQELSMADWVPFERLARAGPPVAVMVGHVVVAQLDPKHVASVSEPLVSGVLRRKFGHRGLVITDDLCMAPVHYSKGGIAARSVEALSAGADLLLISFDPDQIYPTLNALLALPESQIPKKAMAASQRRLRALRARWNEPARREEED